MFKNLFNKGAASGSTSSSNATTTGSRTGKSQDGGKRVYTSRRQSEVPAFKPVEKVLLSPCSVDAFELGPILGTGSFGRVHIARHYDSKTVVAIKMLSKSQILRTKQVLHIKAEKDILMMVNFPFIVNLLGCSQDNDCLYYVLEYIVGGEFFTHLRSSGRFPEETSRFYASEILLSFEYLHSMDVIYRDLKPENLLLEKSGHVKITDFGFAKKIEHRTYTLCGTPDYLAPEIILNKGHGKPVDWWAMGVLIYEMLAGYPPFYDDEPWGTYQKILDGRIEFPSHFTRSSRDVVKKLLQADLTKRYGNLKGGARDVKMHPWFSGIEWQAVVRKEARPPIRPVVKSDDDTSNFDDYSDTGALEHEFELSQDDQELFASF